MKKIKTINKLLSSLTLLSPLTSIGFNSQYQNTQTVITENYNNSLNNYFSSNAQEKMGDITVNVDGTTITGYLEGTGTLEVSSNITEIGNAAFQSNTNITSLDLSQATSLTTIRDSAFESCTKLAGELILPEGITSIGQIAFRSTSFTKIDFSKATNFTTITSNCFAKLSYLENVTVSSNIIEIQNSAFAFIWSSKWTLDLSNATSLTTIGDNAFMCCSNLTGDLVIPSSVTSIGNSAFNGARFTKVSIDSSNQNYCLATNLGPDAYVVLSGTEGIWENTVPVGKIACGKLVIPSNITNIERGFFDSTGVSSLDLSQATSLTTIGENAFSGCLNFTNLVIKSNVLSTIGNSAFDYCYNITSLDLSQATNLTTIGKNAFHGLYELTGDLTIPSSVTSIGENAFSMGRSSLNNLYFLSKTPPSFGRDWEPDNVIGKVYLPSEQAKQAYLSAENFGFSAEQIEILPSKSNIGLILGLLFGLGIPILVAAGFGIWYFTKKKKTSVKI